VLANLLGPQRDGIFFNEIGCRIGVAVVKRRTTKASYLSRIKTT
jgi:hypothetical protein